MLIYHLILDHVTTQPQILSGLLSPKGLNTQLHFKVRWSCAMLPAYPSKLISGCFPFLHFPPATWLVLLFPASLNVSPFLPAGITHPLPQTLFSLAPSHSTDLTWMICSERISLTMILLKQLLSWYVLLKPHSCFLLALKTICNYLFVNKQVLFYFVKQILLYFVLSLFPTKIQCCEGRGCVWLVKNCFLPHFHVLSAYTVPSS